MTDATATTTPRSPRTIAVDNFLRRALRVGDPRDPAQIAAALLTRYPDEAERNQRERQGLPYSTLANLSPQPQIAGAALAELTQARDDLERDTQALLASSELKDIRVELGGWGRTIRRIADDGLAAARLSLDAVQHDRALAARSQLIAYARLARYVGVLSCGAAVHFRRLAQSCDILAGLILVALGEGLAASGVTRGTALVRVAAGELQARRNAVITALRSLSGSVEIPLSQEEWPRGMEAYRLLTAQLDDSGQSDLRTLLEESALALAMDELVDLSAGANINGLRELATASALLVDRFQRLINHSQVVATMTTTSDSPPLVTFASALRLFVDAFTASSGSRLLYVARPPIVIYGLYGASGPDVGADRLIRLTIARGRLAELIDCFACCDCDDDAARCQAMLDFLLGTLDRAIDAYAAGTDPGGAGDPEFRAAACGLLIDQAIALAALPLGPPPLPPVCRLDTALIAGLLTVRDLLLAAVGPAPYAGRPKELMIQELRLSFHGETQTERLVRSLSPACHITGLFDLDFPNPDPPESLVHSLVRQTLRAVFGVEVDLPDPIRVPPTVARSMADLADDWSGLP